MALSTPAVNFASMHVHRDTSVNGQPAKLAVVYTLDDDGTVQYSDNSVKGELLGHTEKAKQIKGLLAWLGAYTYKGKNNELVDKSFNLRIGNALQDLGGQLIKKLSTQVKGLEQKSNNFLESQNLTNLSYLKDQLGQVRQALPTQFFKIIQLVKDGTPYNVIRPHEITEEEQKAFNLPEGKESLIMYWS